MLNLRCLCLETFQKCLFIWRDQGEGGEDTLFSLFLLLILHFALYKINRIYKNRTENKKFVYVKMNIVDERTIFRITFLKLKMKC